MSTGGHQIIRSLLHWRLGTGQRQARKWLPSPRIAPWWERGLSLPPSSSQRGEAPGFLCAAALSFPGSVRTWPPAPLLMPGKTLWKPSDSPVVVRGFALSPGFCPHPLFWVRIRDGMGVRYPGKCGTEQEYSSEPGRSPSQPLFPHGFPS